MEIFLDIAATLYEAKDFHDVGKVIISILREYSNNKWIGGKIGIYNKEIDEYKIYYNSDNRTIDEYDNKEFYTNIYSPSKFKDIKYFSRIVADSKQKLLIQDNTSDESIKIHPAQINLKPHAMLWVPLIYHDEFLGIISLASYPIKSFTDEIIQVVEGIAKLTSIKVNELLKANELIQSEIRFRSIWENSFDGMRLIDENGKIVLVNKAFCKIVNKTKDELEGRPLSIIYASDLQNHILNKSIERFISRSIESHFERELVLWNGEKKWFELSNLFIEPGKGQQLLLSIFRDITEKMKSESDHLRLKNLESIGIFAGGIAHDFNNLLTAILGNASLILENLHDEEVKINILRIIKSTNKASELANQLRIFASGGTPQKSIISIRKIIERLSAISPGGSNIQTDIHFEDSFPLKADPDQLFQAFRIIVINSKEAMPEGGSVTISTLDILKDERPYVKIIIKDTGIGIPKEDLDKIYDPYFSTKTKGCEKGSGLGLSICYSIINKHSGQIFVESQVGIGTTFEILLPAYIPAFSGTKTNIV